MNTHDKPFSPACERNREPILDLLRVAFADCTQVLEIGSGTGQHAVHVAAAMPWLTWQCSDRSEHLPGLRQWLDEAALPNTPPPVQLDVASGAWPRSARADGRFDAMFSANTLHIMGWSEVRRFFAGVGDVLACMPDDGTEKPAARASAARAQGGGTLVVYGPFNADGAFSSDSNRDFDASLRARDAKMGLRDREAVDALAQSIGLVLVDDVAMPANNRCLVWRRGSRDTA